nr:hypothetical protein [uncultured Flavobacterium sp.]
MLEQLLGSLINKEEQTTKTIQSALKKIHAELNCKQDEFFVMIKPVNEQMDFVFYIYMTSGKFIRKISLKEILGEDEE